MRILVDSHVFIWLANGELALRAPVLAARMRDPSHQVSASVASLWELAIKIRLGKLASMGAPEDLPELAAALGLGMLAVEARHVVSELHPEPITRDPFDRLLLAQCAVEGMRLATLDRALAGHPLSLPV